MHRWCIDCMADGIQKPWQLVKDICNDAAFLPRTDTPRRDPKLRASSSMHDIYRAALGPSSSQQTIKRES